MKQKWLGHSLRWVRCHLAGDSSESESIWIDRLPTCLKLRWRSSLWKLVWKEMVSYFLVYFLISVVYRQFLVLLTRIMVPFSPGIC